MGKVGKIICHSDFMRKQLKKYGYESSVIPYPLLSNPEKTEKQKRVVFMGRLTKAKGADLIAPLAEMLHKEGYEIDVIGQGPFGKELRNKEGVILHGFLGDERFDILKRASLLLAPSRWPEPFGIIALEAASCGVPTITLEGSGGLAELVSREGIGITCKESELHRAVVSILSDPNAYDNACRKTVQKYDKEEIFETYKQLFYDVIQ